MNGPSFWIYVGPLLLALLGSAGGYVMGGSAYSKERELIIHRLDVLEGSFTKMDAKIDTILRRVK